LPSKIETDDDLFVMTEARHRRRRTTMAHSKRYAWINDRQWGGLTRCPFFRGQCGS
jgi:hypothetical protein